MKTPNENIDRDELAKFESAASHWWDTNGEFGALHDINPLRLEFIHSRADLSGKNVLDVGCGGGLVSEGLATFGASVTGIDVGDAALSAAKYHMKLSGLEIEYRNISAEKLAETEQEQFDAVTCLELLEHVPNPESIVIACAKLLKPKGELFFATLNRNIKSYVFAIIGGEYLLNLIPRGTHIFGRFIKPSELSAWGQSAGLTVKEMMGLHYNPFTRKYSLGGNLHVNYMVHFRKQDILSGKQRD
jgi:2-polyprenyl-6-hydroxyphenyl methylase/3-demethylubiquinone-9 3-methyltransferase